MFELGYFLLALAVLGSISSTVFLALALVGTWRFWSEGRRQQSDEEKTNELPLVSILKPLHGLEPQLERNLESFFQQDYPAFEVLFAVDHADDAALPVAQAVCARFPHIPSKILITGEPPWPNPPAWTFSHMTREARSDYLVTSDSDVEVAPDYLRSVVTPLLAPGTGMVTCLYRGLNKGGFWSMLDAVGMSVEMTAGVLVANLLEGMKFGLGPTIAVRRDALDAIGGYAVLGDYFSNDFMIGNLIAAKGYRVVLSRHVISHVVPPMTFSRMWFRQVRWATGTKHSRAKGHFGTVFVYAIPYGLLAFVAGLLTGNVLLGIVLLAWSVVNRVIESYVVGWGVTRDVECLRKLWIYPVRDLFGFCVWIASYLSRHMRWRDGRFELVAGGKILVRDRNGEAVRMSNEA